MIVDKSPDELKEGIDYYSDMYDLLGTEDPSWSPKKVKELLRGLIESGIIEHMDGAALASLLITRGVLNIENRHKEFFKNLIPASQTEGGFEAIKEYAYSKSQYPPNLSGYQKEMTTEISSEEKIEEISDQEIKTEKYDPLKNPEIESVTNILKQCEGMNLLLDPKKLESISVDSEIMEFFVNYYIHKLWQKVFEDEQNTINYILKQKKKNNPFSNEVLGRFLYEYNEIKNMKLPNMSSNFIPTSMQKYVAYRVKSRSNFGNFSGTGTGKTLAAILASKTCNFHNTLVVCPNDVIYHWENEINSAFPGTTIISGKKVFSSKYDPSINQFLILNWDKLNQSNSTNDVINLSQQKIDFIVLDEIQFTKAEDTIRRKNLVGLMTNAKRKNKNIKILGMSATPVVNKLEEGKSLLELITGKVFHDVKTRPIVANAITLYQKFTNMSIRQRTDYAKARYEFVEVQSPMPDRDTIRLIRGRPLGIEQLLTQARIPEIIKRINGPTIIYTEYVGTNFPGRPTILEMLEEAVKKAKFGYGFYTGENDTGMKPFREGKIQVLIASRPISVGVDGLQKVCNNLIFNTLPWTNAQYRQIIGRVVRTGQTKNDVHIHHIKASFPGVLYDEYKKLRRINYKKTLADCAVDGILPEKNLVTPQQAIKEAVKWLERLERGEISVVSRRDLEVELTPVEIKKRNTKYGDFTKLNRKINTENSKTTHERMTKNPEEWIEYHRLLDETSKEWNIIPWQYWVKRLVKLSERLIIGDFGCGRAKISEEPNLAGRVKSFDHVALEDFSRVTPCDMKDLREYVNDGDLDVVVFSLSLMGKDWEGYIKEAKRCLAQEGLLFITETTNSLDNRLARLRDVIKENRFEIYSDEAIDKFTFFEARKLNSE